MFIFDYSIVTYLSILKLNVRKHLMTCPILFQPQQFQSFTLRVYLALTTATVYAVSRATLTQQPKISTNIFNIFEMMGTVVC